jgi:maltooligosyltrehalose trehalohydrolase
MAIHEKAGRRCGALATERGVRWRVWAPLAKRVELMLQEGEGRRAVEMLPEAEGYFAVELGDIVDGQRYTFRLDGGEQRPDPCSLWQPANLPGPSAVVFPEKFKWSDGGWKGIQRGELVIYELHVGTFTGEGTFDAIVPRLKELRELGVTAIELMPVGQFPGGRNWGYDGVLPYAAQDTYGGPAALARLVDAAHRAGLAVILDVVYNHFGPEHNYLSEFGPYLIDCYQTPWGKAVNFDGPECGPVRDYVLDNARMWLEEFHFDGLRLDAVHAIYDLGARHILAAIKEMAAGVEQRSGRAIHVIAESDLNDPRVLRGPEQGGYGLDAQWADDFHHAAHAFLTGEQRGYYSDFGSPEQVARSLETPFVYAWTYSKHRRRKHGAPADGLGADRFVVCLQNHDQVGNRAMGERLSELLGTPEKMRAAAALLLLSPYIPMLFMGEEYGELRRFPFFCSFCGEELLQAVREGRKREFADFVGAVEEIPDPGSEETFRSAVLTWAWPEGTVHAGVRRLYGDLLKARREWPALRAGGAARRAEVAERDEGGCLLRYDRGAGLRVLFNLSGHPREVEAGRILWTSEAAAYGGRRKAGAAAGTPLLPYEVVAIAE